MQSEAVKRGGEPLQAFVRFCANLRVEDGGAFELEPYQQELLSDYFAGTDETLVLIPKKNGKTTLLAALAIYHLLLVEDAECVVGAASRDQATILYDQALGFVRRAPGLQKRMVGKRGYREIRSLVNAGRIRVLASDVDHADGVIPTLALVDELHRHKSAGLYGVFRDGLGPRRGQMITISTAGDNEGSPLGLLRSAARELPVREQVGRHLHARSADGTFALHEWALDKEDDSDDLDVVKEVNPASWWTPKALRLAHDSPSMLPWQWLRFRCGVWVAGDAWWMRPERWRESEVHDRFQKGDAIALGFDGSRYHDSTALIGCRIEDGLIQTLGVWEAPENGDHTWEVPVGEVDALIDLVMDEYAVVRAYFDPPLWQTEIDQWARLYGDSAVMRFWTARSRMMAAVERFRTDVTAGIVPHVADARLDRHVLNAQVKETRGGYWLVRRSEREKIDCAVAAVLAYEARSDVLIAGADIDRTDFGFF